MKHLLQYILILIASLTLLTACADLQEVTRGVVGRLTVVVTENPLTVPGRGDTYNFRIDADTEDVEWECTTNASWIKIGSKEGKGTSFVDFEVMRNPEPFGRVSFINVRDKSVPNDKYTIQIRQKGYLGNVNQTMTNDMLQKHRMGYGYNIKGSYMSDSSFSESPILSYGRIEIQEKDLGTEIITENRRFVEELEVITGSTLTEIRSKMTQTMDKNSTFLGCGSTTHEEKTVFDRRDNMDEVGVVRLKQIVTSRTIDKGMLLTQNLGYAGDEVNTSLLSKEFIEALNELSSLETGGKFVEKFGTHLVLSADLGGVLNLNTTIRRNTSVHTESSVKSIAKKIFGKKVAETSSTYDKVSNSDNIDYKAELECYGGDTCKLNVSAKISGDEIKGEITQAELQDWQNSFQLGDGMSGLEYNAALVDCRIIPIYEIIKDAGKKALVKAVIESYLGVDSISDKHEDMPCGMFSVADAISEWDSERHQYALKLTCDGHDVAVICKEYVPVISSDHPCIVAYPIYEGRPFLYSGTFIGDADHRPGTVRWVGSRPIYEPNDSISYDEPRFAGLFDPSTHALKNIYLYWNGVQLTPNKFITEYNKTTCSIAQKRLSGVSVYDVARGYPVVKVGPCFWFDQSLRMQQSYDWEREAGFDNVRQRIGYGGLYYMDIKGTNNVNYYNLVATLPGNVSSYVPEAVRNVLPTAAQAQSLIAVTGGRVSVMDKVYQNHRNLLGLRWAKGFKAVYSANTENEADKKIKDCDSDAWMVLTKDGSGGVNITRLSASGTAVTYTFEDYFSSVNYSDQRFYKFFPLYICTDIIE